jgi:divalent metal cation (Fe/Co/Zn/Cd) transporter
LSIYNSIYLYSDNICTFIIGIYIIYVSYKILKDNVISIIGVNEEDNDYIEKIKNKVLSSDEIVGVNNVNLLKYGSYYSCDIEVVMKKNIKLKDISIITNKLKRKLCNKRTRIRYITISVVPEE